MAKYWDQEKPSAIIVTPKNVLTYYTIAQKLHVGRSAWLDDDGKQRPGKTVSLDVEALMESDIDALKQARSLFGGIATLIYERIELIS